MEFLDRLFDKRVTLAGDREYGEDPGVEAGIAWVAGLRCVYVAAEHSLASPEAYAKAARMLRLAEKTGAPCVNIGAAATSHLSNPDDGRAAGALDGYVRTLATADARSIAVLDATPSVDISDDFDRVVVAPLGAGAPQEEDAARVGLTVALRELDADRGGP